jgi:hypothetical protein
MTPAAQRRIALEVWFPRIPAEKARAHLPPSDDRPPAEKGAAAAARRIALDVWFPRMPVADARALPRLPDTPADKAQPPKQTRVRKPTLSHALKQAGRAGRQVKGAAIYADRVEITFGEPEAAEAEATPAVSANDINEWDADLGTLPPEVRQ